MLHRRLARLIAFLVTPGWVLMAPSVYAGPAPNHVRDVKVHPAEGIPGATEIEVVGTETPTWSVRAEAGGKRLLVDMGNTDVVGAPEALTDSQGAVGGVQTQAFKTDTGSMTRLTVNLAKDATYRVRADGTTLRM